MEIPASAESLETLRRKLRSRRRQILEFPADPEARRSLVALIDNILASLMVDPTKARVAICSSMLAAIDDVIYERGQDNRR
jgi:DNA-binding transcriptional regulator YbjK